MGFRPHQCVLHEPLFADATAVGHATSMEFRTMTLCHAVGNESGKALPSLDNRRCKLAENPVSGEPGENLLADVNAMAAPPIITRQLCQPDTNGIEMDVANK